MNSVAAPAENVYVINGWFRKQRRHDVLAYVAATADEALANCRRNNPGFDVDYIRLDPTR